MNRRGYDEAVQRPARLADLLANAITHGLGAGLAIFGAGFLTSASLRGPARCVVGCSVFSVTLILLYLCSTLYHSFERTRLQKIFRVLDHSAIYLLIAGTYTPFALVSLHGPLGWTLLAVQWALATGGVVFKLFWTGRYEWLSASFYLAQGWLMVVALHPLQRAVGWSGLAWIGAGGVAYTTGLLFYAFDRRRFFHATWHLFVLAGSLAHYFAVLWFVVPPQK